MTTCEKNQNNTAPSVDFSLQFCLATDNEKVEEDILGILKNMVSEARHDVGAIVVFGDFSKSRQCVAGLIQMKPKTNPITSLIMIDSKEGAEIVKTFSMPPHDGAIVVDKTGQILGAGIYLMVNHPTLELPEGCGTRHKAAASFSLHNDVISVLTLSEETNIIRLWRDGKEEEVIEIELGDKK
jgi:DNA integrity scanning protein DisA with diadenylate cyclase activity